MKLTNKSNLPAALLKAMANDPYDKGDSDFSVTGLIKPARLSALEERHAHEIEEDVEDGLYRLYGQLVHALLERANEVDLCETRYFYTFNVNGKDYKISAQMDTLTLTSGKLRDFKFTTSWGFNKNREPKADWIAQLNVQRELMLLNGEDRVKSLEIVGLLRDWQIREAKYNPDYPSGPVAIQPIPVWSSAQTQAYIKMRIAAHVDAKVNLPECSPEEIWQKPTQWAVIKKGGKRAINGGVQLSPEAAAKVQEKNPGTFIEHRPGELTRCNDYCPVAQFCTQFARSKTKENKESESA